VVHRRRENETVVAGAHAKEPPGTERRLGGVVQFLLFDVDRAIVRPLAVNGLLDASAVTEMVRRR
jgi:hypothetical protein